MFNSAFSRIELLRSSVRCAGSPSFQVLRKQNLAFCQQSLKTVDWATCKTSLRLFCRLCTHAQEVRQLYTNLKRLPGQARQWHILRHIAAKQNLKCRQSGFLGQSPKPWPRKVSFRNSLFYGKAHLAQSADFCCHKNRQSMCTSPKKIAGSSPAMTDLNQRKGIFKGTPLNGAGKG